MRSPVVVTGLGAVSAGGVGVAALAELVFSGRSGVRKLDDERFARNFVRQAAISDFEPAAYLPAASVRMLDRFAAMALVAAAEAIGQAGWDDGVSRERVAVIIGSGIGGAETSEQASSVFHAGAGRGDPLAIPKIMVNAAASQVAMAHGLTGPVLAVSSACSSSAQAIGMGMQLIAAGIVDRAVVGGAEAMITSSVLRAWELLRVLAPGPQRPFSSGRDGMVLGEGAAVLVLEAADLCGGRVEPLARLCGYGTTSDAKDLLRPDPQSAARSMGLALADAGVTPEAIGYVNAHGTGTVLNDISETEALRLAFGPHLRDLPVSSTKPAHGHAIGAAGAMEAIVTILALRRQLVPPTLNWLGPDPRCDIDCVPLVARPAGFTHALSNSFAFGGINASLVFSR